MYFLENIGKHFCTQTACLGVITAAMIGVHQPAAVRQRVAGAVAEGIWLQFQIQGPQHGIMGDFAKGQDQCPPAQCTDFTAQIIITHPDLFPGGFIFRRQAFYRIGDTAIFQPQFIIAMGGLGLVTETEVMECLVQQDPGIISGKRPAGGIGTVHTGGQADYQQPGIGDAERRDGTGMVVRILPAYTFKVCA